MFFKSKYLNDVYAFADKHFVSENIRRKYTDEPYMVHPLAVAKIVESVTDDENMIAAALLHDTVEDTNVTLEDILKEFGRDVHDMVDDLTNISIPEDGNRATRKALDLNHTSGASIRSKTIKLADLIDNSRKITKYNVKFCKVYMIEKKALLEVLKDADPTLYNDAKGISDAYFNE